MGSGIVGRAASSVTRDDHCLNECLEILESLEINRPE